MNQMQIYLIGQRKCRIDSGQKSMYDLLGPVSTRMNMDEIKFRFAIKIEPTGLEKNQLRFPENFRGPE